MNDVDVFIAGGGISGLSTAWWLAQRGLTVEVWERDAEPGGKIRTDKVDGYLTERAAVMVMNFRPEVNQLIAGCALDGHKTPRADMATRYLVNKGRLQPAPLKLGSLITSPLWSWQAKLRLLAEPFIPKGGHEHETVSDFVRRRLGDEPLENVMEPYVAGPLASDPDQASARAVLPRLTALEQRYGSLTLGVLAHRVLRRRTGCPVESFSFAGGMSTLITALANSAGVRLRPRWQVTAIEPVGDEAWLVTGQSPQGEHRLQARRLVLSVPANVAATLLVSPWDRELGALLRETEYAPLSVVHLGFDRAVVRHSLNGAGFLVPRRERLCLNGVLWMNALFPDRAPAGKVLLTAYVGGVRLPEAADWGDDHTVDQVMAGLAPLLDIGAAPEMVRVDRHRHALPLYHGAYCGRMAAIAARLQQLRGLHLEANYRGGVSVRDRLVCAHAAAQRIIASMRLSEARALPTVEGRNLTPEFGT